MFRLVSIFFLVGLTACVDPFSVDIEDSQQLLSVDGFITTEPGVHTFRLTRSDKYGSVFDGLVVPILRANVSIRDNNGETVFLTETTRGVYITPNDYAAEIGKSYSIQIELTSGERYTSIPEAVYEVPKLDSITYKEIVRPTANPDLNVVGIELSASLADPAGQSNFYYWRNRSATYVLFTNPELVVDEDRNPTPKDCCSRCYFTEQPGRKSISVASDRNFNGLSTSIPVTFLADNGSRFRDFYRLDMQQLSISPKAYDFLRLLKQQIEISGSVFDPPPANLRSNIINIDNPNEVVLGYFFAADQSTKRIYIDGTKIKLGVPNAIIPDDCRTVPGAVFEEPSDWSPFGN
jgi:hypothetical protein